MLYRNYETTIVFVTILYLTRGCCGSLHGHVAVLSDLFVLMQFGASFFMFNVQFVASIVFAMLFIKFPLNVSVFICSLVKFNLRPMPHNR